MMPDFFNRRALRMWKDKCRALYDEQTDYIAGQLAARKAERDAKLRNQYLEKRLAVIEGSRAIAATRLANLVPGARAAIAELHHEANHPGHPAARERALLLQSLFDIATQATTQPK